MKRYIGYCFWVGLEVVFFVGLPHLVIFPIAANLVGKEQFGLFIFALGIVMIVGQAPSVGLATGVIRHLALLDSSGRDQLVGTSIHLCRIAMFVIAILGIVVSVGVWLAGSLDGRVLGCLIPLNGFLILWNLFDLQLVRCRVERRFAVRTLWYVVVSLMLFAVIPSAYWGGAVGMAWGYMAAFLVAYVVLSHKHGLLLRPPLHDKRSAHVLKEIWWHISVASALALSSRYLYRIILGAFHSYADVSVFFGATNIIDLFLSPVTILGSMLLSLLGGFVRIEDVSRRQKHLVLCGAVFLCCTCTGLLMLCGRFMLELLFPEFGAESWPVLRGLVLIVPCVIIIAFARPFVVKFGCIKLIPFLNMLVLASHLVPGLILIPRLATKGAMMSCNVGYALSATLWLAALVWTVKSETMSKRNMEARLACEQGGAVMKNMTN